jgi:hypothetical protein
MGWIERSLPPEPDDPPPAPRPPPTELERLAAERAALLGQIRPRLRTRRQMRIRERIAGLTRKILTLTTGDVR